MSSSSTVTYTSVYTDSEPGRVFWGADEELFDGGHRADYGFIGTMDAEVRRQRAEEVGFGIRDVWVDPTEVVEEVAPTTLEGVNARVTELVAVQEQDTQDIYAVIEDTQDGELINLEMVIRLV
ncbi:hypothetical protein Tco_0365891 [Tanacetum coccineum]